jgi:hypothetical protein
MTSGLRITLAVCVACMLGCGDEAPASAPNLQVRGNIWNGPVSIIVERKGTGDDSAIVRLNGDLLRPIGSGTGRYYGDSLGSTLPGAQVYLEISSGESSLIGAGWMPSAPVITSPAQGTAFGSGQDVVVTFDPHSSAPERFSVYAAFAGGGGWSADVAPGYSSLTIPAVELPAGEDVTLSVRAYSAMTFAGDYDATSSGVELGSVSASVTISH